MSQKLNYFVNTQSALVDHTKMLARPMTNLIFRRNYSSYYIDFTTISFYSHSMVAGGLDEMS